MADNITISEGLLDECKNYLDITWELDQASESKLVGQLSRGIAYISGKTGVPVTDFSGETVNLRAQELLFNYVLYDRAGALAEFKRTYTSDVVGMRIIWEVDNAARAED